ncbi:MAG: hypothetical protein V2I46_05230 [Bacteroides sp.]|jgi:hypothetical protein|nr:hypothetical protein [Bacteroides sp.]
MKKQFFGILFILLTLTLTFTSCQKDPLITLNGGDVELDLGEDFVDPGYETEGISGDVQELWNPEFSKYKVNHYVLTYVYETANAQRNVYVKSDLLAGTYSVVDVSDDGTFTYNSSVAQSSQAFNRLIISNLGDFEGIPDVLMDIEGDVITIERQELWTSQEWVEGTGTYNGETQSLIEIDYTMTYLVGGDPRTITGTLTFTKL